MFDKNKIFYTNEDYTVRMEKIDGCEKYYLKFHSETTLPEQEITFDIFMLYYDEFRKPLDNKRNEYRRHIADSEIDGYAKSGKLTITLFENECVNKADLETALKTCTPIQKKRFDLHYIQGFTMEEIAEMESCSKQSVSRSIAYVVKKIKNYF